MPIVESRIERQRIGGTTSLALPNVNEGRGIPIVYGTQMVTGTIAQFGGYKNGWRIGTEFKDEGGNKKTAIPFWLVLCFGKVRLNNILEKNGDTYKTYLDPHNNGVYGAELKANWNDGTGEYYPTGIYHPGGGALQYLTALHGIAHQYFPLSALVNMRVGYYAAEPLEKFMVQVTRDLSGLPIAGANIGISNNPIAVIYDLLTNAQYGCAIKGSLIDLPRFNAVAEWMYAKGMGISLTINESMECRKIIDEICAQCGIELWRSKDGMYKVAVYNPDDILHYKDAMSSSDFISFSFSRKQFDELPNEYKFTITKNKTSWSAEVDISEMSREEIRPISNDSLYNLTAEKIVETPDLSMLCEACVVKRMYDVVRQNSYPAMTINCEINMKYAERELMDVVMVTNEEAGINNIPFRVKAIKYKGIEENKLQIELEEAIEINKEISKNLDIGLRSLPQYSESADVVKIYFPAYSYMSNVRVPAFTNENNAVVAWGPGQENFGVLERFTDYTIIDMNKIRLTAKWQSTVEANSLGLLNVQTYEAT